MRFGHGCRFILSMQALVLLAAADATAAAAPQDHPLVKRYPEAKVVKRSVRDLESYWVPLGKLFGDGQATKFQVVEGKWTHVTYSNPPKSSVIEIGRRYDQQLRDAGFEIVYDCRDGECGQGGRKTNGDWWDPNYQRRYLVAKLARERGDVWACIHVQAKGPNVPGQHDVDVIEAKPEPRELPVVRNETDPAWIEKQLSEKGHVALYGIRFDPKRSTLLPGSESTLKAVAELLRGNPQRRLMVVVHTDDLTNWKAGVQNSRRQAGTLVSAIVKAHRVPAARLVGDGVGPLAPAAPASDAPKGAGSRRVEIVALTPAGAPLRAGNPD